MKMGSVPSDNWRLFIPIQGLDHFSVQLSASCSYCIFFPNIIFSKKYLPFFCLLGIFKIQGWIWLHCVLFGRVRESTIYGNAPYSDFFSYLLNLYNFDYDYANKLLGTWKYFSLICYTNFINYSMKLALINVLFDL